MGPLAYLFLKYRPSIFFFLSLVSLAHGFFVGQQLSILDSQDRIFSINKSHGVVLWVGRPRERDLVGLVEAMAGHVRLC